MINFTNHKRFDLNSTTLLRSVFSSGQTMLLATLLVSGLTTTAQTGPGGVGSSATNRLWVVAGESAYTDAGTTQATNGQSVQQWSDLSGNGDHLTQTTSDRRPLLTTGIGSINNHAALTFDGSNDLLDGAMGGTFTNTSLFVIGNFSVADQTTFDYMINIGSDYTDGVSLGRNTSERYYSYTEGSTRSGPVLNTDYMMFHQYFTGSAPYHFLRINGSTQTVGSPSAQINIGSNIRIGAMLFSSGVHYLTGNVAEVILYDTDLNTTQRILVENYLDAKYGLGSSSDKYGFETNHGNDVAGIGQESAGDNHTDARGGSIVQVNNASDLEDGEYMLWGHDGAGTGNNSTETPASYSGDGLRLDQEWRVDLSGGDGSVGTVDITFDMAGIGFGVDPNDYDLLSDSDGNFSAGSTVHATAPTINGDEITFSGVTLADGDYFTIGNTNDVDDCIAVTSNSWGSAIWTCGADPDSTANVLISDGTTITITGTESANDFAIEMDGGAGGGSVVMNANSTLIVKGDFDAQSGSSLTMGSGSTIILRGTGGQQTFTNSTGSTLSLYNLEINNADGVVLASDDFELNNALTLTNGDLSNNTNFTFLSTVTRTAHVDPVPNGSSLAGSGDYHVQRFIAARTANWNDIASSGVDTDLEDLDGEIFTSGITGSDGYAVGSGGGSFVSIFYYDETGTPDDYVAPSSTADAFEIGRGYEVWLADDPSNWDAKAWSLTGDIDLSAAAISVNSADSRWNLLGNPYPAFLDFEAIAATSGGIDNDEYWYYDANTSTYISVSGGGSYLPPGQGFWVQTTGITELNINPSSHILSGENSSDFFKSAEKPELKVYLKNENEPFASAVYVRQNPTAFVGKDDMDIPPLRLPDPRACHMVIEQGADESMVNYVSTDEPVIELPLKVETGLSGEYTLSLQGLEYFKDYKCVNLYNEETGEQIAMSSESAYGFTIDDVSSIVNMKLVLSKEDQVDCEAPVQVTDESVTVWSDNKTVYVDFYLDRTAEAEIEIFNVLGKRVYNQSSNVSYARKRLDLSNAESGVYFVTVSINGSSTTDKIVLK